ncbi:hypothetical protein BGX27_006945 [Mortierella sp. AM989]|nr:hypothetical protein BGX27_006945 [Mortierella sp. AM989]
MKIPEEFYIANVGLDAVMFLRFIRMCLQFCIFNGIWMDLRREYTLQRIRQGEIAERSIFISRLPSNLRSDAALKQYFESLKMGPVDSATVVQHCGRLSQKIDRRESTLNMLEKTHIELAQEVLEKIKQGKFIIPHPNDDKPTNLHGSFLMPPKLDTAAAIQTMDSLSLESMAENLYQDKKWYHKIRKSIFAHKREPKVTIPHLNVPLSALAHHSDIIDVYVNGGKEADLMGSIMSLHPPQFTIWNALVDLDRGSLDEFQPTRPANRFKGSDRVTSIDYLVKKYNRLDRKVGELRDGSLRYKSTSFGFVTFKHHLSAQLCAQAKIDSRPQGLSVRLAMEPRDVLWSNLTSSFRNRFTRSVFVKLSICPLILLAAAVHFAFALLVFKYQLAYCYIRKYENSGRFFRLVFQYSTDGLIIFQITMVGVLWLKKAPIAGFLIVALIGLTVYFKILCGDLFKSRSKFLPLDTGLRNFDNASTYTMNEIPASLGYASGHSSAVMKQELRRRNVSGQDVESGIDSKSIAAEGEFDQSSKMHDEGYSGPVIDIQAASPTSPYNDNKSWSEASNNAYTLETSPRSSGTITVNGDPRPKSEIEEEGHYRGSTGLGLSVSGIIDDFKDGERSRGMSRSSMTSKAHTEDDIEPTLRSRQSSTHDIKLFTVGDNPLDGPQGYMENEATGASLLGDDKASHTGGFLDEDGFYLEPYGAQNLKKVPAASHFDHTPSKFIYQDHTSDFETYVHPALLKPLNRKLWLPRNPLYMYWDLDDTVEIDFALNSSATANKLELRNRNKDENQQTPRLSGEQYRQQYTQRRNTIGSNFDNGADTTTFNWQGCLGDSPLNSNILASELGEAQGNKHGEKVSQPEDFGGDGQSSIQYSTPSRNGSRAQLCEHIVMGGCDFDDKKSSVKGHSGLAASNQLFSPSSPPEGTLLSPPLHLNNWIGPPNNTTRYKRSASMPPAPLTAEELNAMQGGEDYKGSLMPTPALLSTASPTLNARPLCNSPTVTHRGYPGLQPQLPSSANQSPRVAFVKDTTGPLNVRSTMFGRATKHRHTISNGQGNSIHHGHPSYHHLSRENAHVGFHATLATTGFNFGSGSGADAGGATGVSSTSGATIGPSNGAAVGAQPRRGVVRETAGAFFSMIFGDDDDNVLEANENPRFGYETGGIWSSRRGSTGHCDDDDDDEDDETDDTDDDTAHNAEMTNIGEIPYLTINMADVGVVGVTVGGVGFAGNARDIGSKDAALGNLTLARPSHLDLLESNSEPSSSTSTSIKDSGIQSGRQNRSDTLPSAREYPCLPYECLQMIVADLSEDKKTLRSLLVVNKVFFQLALPHLMPNPLESVTEKYLEYVQYEKHLALALTSLLETKLRGQGEADKDVQQVEKAVDALLKPFGLKLVGPFVPPGFQMLMGLYNRLEKSKKTSGNGIKGNDVTNATEANNSGGGSSQRLSTDYSRFFTILNSKDWEYLSFHWMIRLRRLPAPRKEYPDSRSEFGDYDDYDDYDDGEDEELGGDDHGDDDYYERDRVNISAEDDGEHTINQQQSSNYKYRVREALVQLWLHYNRKYITYFSFDMTFAESYLPFAKDLEKLSTLDISRPYSALTNIRLQKTVQFIKLNQAAFPAKPPLDIKFGEWYIDEDEDEDEDDDDDYFESSSYYYDKLEKSRGLSYRYLSPRIAIFEAVGHPKSLNVSDLPRFYEQALRIKCDKISTLIDHDEHRMSSGEGPAMAAFLKRCVKLRSLGLAVGSTTMLSWAANEVLKTWGLTRSELPGPNVQQDSTPIYPTGMLNSLEVLGLSFKHSYRSALYVLNDAMVAFSSSIRSVDIDGQFGENPFREGIPPEEESSRAIKSFKLRKLPWANQIGEWPLLLPHLQTLMINLHDVACIQVGSFSQCPNLECLRIHFGGVRSPLDKPDDKTIARHLKSGGVKSEWIQADTDYTLFPIWNLPKLKELELHKLAALRFDFASLSSMKQLKSLDLIAVSFMDIYPQETFDMAAYQDYQSRIWKERLSQQPSDEQKTSAIRSVEWSLPALEKLTLKGSPATMFHLDWLNGCPNLRTLSLDSDDKALSIDHSPFFAVDPNMNQCHIDGDSDACHPNKLLSSISITGTWTMLEEKLRHILDVHAPSAEVLTPNQDQPSSSDYQPVETKTAHEGKRYKSIDDYYDEYYGVD